MQAGAKKKSGKAPSGKEKLWFLQAVANACKRLQSRRPRVRDQEVGGSNPLAPTNFPFSINKISILRSAKRRSFYLSGPFPGLDLLVSHRGVGRDLGLCFL